MKYDLFGYFINPIAENWSFNLFYTKEKTLGKGFQQYMYKK